MPENPVRKYFNKKVHVAIFLFAILVVATWIFFFRVFSVNGNIIEHVIIGEQTFFLERVTSKEKLHLGLGKRNSICKRCGMLFVFPDKKEHTFWMKEMRFDIDVIWLNDGEIVLIEREVSNKSLEVMGRGVISDKVIEINAGETEKLGVKIGDKVTF